MKYYMLTTCLGTDVFNGFTDDYDVLDSQSLHAQGQYGPIESEPIVPIILIKGNRKKTDLMEVHLTSKYLCISPRFLIFLKDYLKAPYQVWDTVLRQKDKEFAYHILHVSYSTPCIDYSKSLFYMGKSEVWNDIDLAQPIYPTSFESFKQINREYQMLAQKRQAVEYQVRVKKIVMDFSKQTSPIIRVYDVEGTGYFVSEELKQAIEDAKLTGCRFVDPSEDDMQVVPIFD